MFIRFYLHFLSFFVFIYLLFCSLLMRLFIKCKKRNMVSFHFLAFRQKQKTLLKWFAMHLLSVFCFVLFCFLICFVVNRCCKNRTWLYLFTFIFIFLFVIYLLLFCYSYRLLLPNYGLWISFVLINFDYLQCKLL